MKYNHLYEINIEVVSDWRDARDVTPEMVRAAVLAELARMDRAQDWDSFAKNPSQTDETEDAA
jgi:hypothetical protein